MSTAGDVYIFKAPILTGRFTCVHFVTFIPFFVMFLYLFKNTLLKSKLNVVKEYSLKESINQTTYDPRQLVASFLPPRDFGHSITMPTFSMEYISI